MSQATAVVDFGTSHSVAVVDGRLLTVHGAPWLRSGVFADRDGRLVVGPDALRMALAEPARFEPHPKARIDDGEVLLGDVVVPVTSMIAAVLRELTRHAERLAGGPVQHLVLTHPADWGARRIGTLLTAAQGLAPRTTTIVEPVAAAALFADHDRLPVGGVIGVLDFGGGTCDAAAIRREKTGPAVLACAGLPDLGGDDLDQLIIDAIPGLPDNLGRRELLRLRTDVRHAKELLSRHPQADLALPPPLPDTLLTRAEFERLVEPDLRRAVALLRETVRLAGLGPADLSGIQLVGGSSRIPLLARLLGAWAPVPIRLDEQPEAVVALGAGHLVRGESRPAASDTTAPLPVQRQAAQVSAPTPTVTDRPAPSRRRVPMVALTVAIVLLVATTAVAIVRSGRTVEGTPVTGSLAHLLPPAPDGFEIVTEGQATDGLTETTLGRPVPVIIDWNRLNWTLVRVTDPAGDMPPQTGKRWVLAEIALEAVDQKGTPPYFDPYTYLIDDRGLFVSPKLDAPLPADCPRAHQEVLPVGARTTRCFAFQVPETLPVTGLATAQISHQDDGGRQRGALVRLSPKRAVGTTLARPGRPMGTPTASEVDGVPVRIAVMDMVFKPSRYFDREPVALRGSRAVLVRTIVDGPVYPSRAVQGLTLQDDRGTDIAWLRGSGANTARFGCVDRADSSDTSPGEAKAAGPVVVCTLFAVPTGTPLRSAVLTGPRGETARWELPGA